MQILSRVVLLLLVHTGLQAQTKPDKPIAKPAKPPKTHSVTLGPVRVVPYTPAETLRANKSEESTTLKVRALYIDTRQHEWTMGELHDVTDRSFTVRRALRINDRLPTETEDRWTSQPGPRLLIGSPVT